MLRYNLEKEGSAVDAAADGEEALLRIAERGPTGGAGLDAAAGLGYRGLPAAAPRPETRNPADDHADRPRRGGDRIRGLDTGADDYVGQAVQDERAGRPAARGAAPRPARAGRGRAAPSPTSRMDRAAHRVQPGRRGGPSRAHRIPPAATFLLSTPAGCSPASSCSTRSGARTSTSRPARSTSTSAGCAWRSTAAAARICSAP